MKSERGQRGVEEVMRGLRAIFATTYLMTETMLKEIGLNPERKKEIFEQYAQKFKQEKKDPWVWEPAILDNYDILDDFARSIYERHNYEGVQNIIAHMENPIMINSILTDGKGAMLHWPGFSEYQWVKDCSWEEFTEKATEIKNGQLLLKKGEHVASRYWLAEATAYYFNPNVNPTFDRQFPQWREAHLIGEALRYDASNIDHLTIDRLAKRKHYVAQIAGFMLNEQNQTRVMEIIRASPQTFST
ncbi:MAG: hypothetical protein Q7R31_02455 [Candidatus Levybacteria bacterium]|nr:hypothetical protein [Candidatus Levybacteria bacterium]